MDDPESWTLVFRVLSRDVPAANRIRTLLKTAKRLGLVCVWLTEPAEQHLEAKHDPHA